MMRHKRTNVVLDMDKVKRIKERYGLRTTTAAVDYALDVVAGRPMSWEEIQAMRGANAIGFIPPDPPPEDL